MKTPYDYPWQRDPLQQVPYLVFNPHTGEIVRWGNCPFFGLENKAEIDTHVIMGVGEGATHYVDPGTLAIKERTPCPATVNGSVIVAIPNPSIVTILDKTFHVTDGEIDLTGSDPGFYEVTISSVAYLDQTLQVTVT